MTDKPTQAQMDRLPKWARHHIELLHANLENREKEMRALFATSEDDAQVILQYFYGVGFRDTDEQTLPKNQRVRFIPHGRENDDMWRGYIDVHINHQLGALELHAGDTLQIEPHSTNVAMVRVKRLD